MRCSARIEQRRESVCNQWGWGSLRTRDPILMFTQGVRLAGGMIRRLWW